MSRNLDMPISQQTERQMIETILSMYTSDKKAITKIAEHIAVKLTDRRRVLRQRRKGQP